METNTVFPTKPLLRPEQAQNAKEDIKSLEKKLDNKHIENKGEVARQLAQARRDFVNQLPQAPANGDEEGRMVKRAKSLLEQITVGMPSQEEMRKAPPGAVDKHLAWERRNKPKIMEWKHIMLRLTAGSGDKDAANLEKHRPVASSLNMDNAHIPGKQFFMPETTGPVVTFTDEQIALLRSVDPEMAERLSTLTNPQRQKVKDIVGIGLIADAPKQKRKMSEEHKQKMLAGQKRAREAKAAKKE